MLTQAVSGGRFARRVKETAGRGRACLRMWPQACIAVVIKRTHKKRVVEVTRKMVEGTLEQAQVLVLATWDIRSEIKWKRLDSDGFS
jgi:hypothetical protein